MISKNVRLMLAGLAIFAGLTACKDVTAPAAEPDYYVQFAPDTLRATVDPSTPAWYVGMTVTIVGAVNQPDQRVQWSVDRPDLAKVSLREYNVQEDYGATVPTTYFNQTIAIAPTGKLTGTVTVTVWPPSDPRKKKVLVMTISSSLPGVKG